MIFEIYDSENNLVNTVVADKDFVEAHMLEPGYTFKRIISTKEIYEEFDRETFFDGIIKEMVGFEEDELSEEG